MPGIADPRSAGACQRFDDRARAEIGTADAHHHHHIGLCAQARGGAVNVRQLRRRHERFRHQPAEKIAARAAFVQQGGMGQRDFTLPTPQLFLRYFGEKIRIIQR